MTKGKNNVPVTMFPQKDFICERVKLRGLTRTAARPTCSLPTRREVIDQKISPSIRAALIDSLFETPAPMLAGIVFVRHRGGHDRDEDREQSIWACVALLDRRRRRRARSTCSGTRRGKSTLTADEAARWKKRYQIGATIQAAAVGIWCSTTLLVS